MQKDNMIDRIDIEAATERIITSGVLGEKSRLRDLLRFVVNEALDGRSDHLKAYTIGTLALGRSDDFDPSNDSIVRVEMNRLRQALDHFYVTTGVNEPVRIDIPKGTYKPVFSSVEVAPGVTSQPSDQDAEPTPTVTVRGFSWKRRVAVPVSVGIIGLLFLLGVVVYLIQHQHHHVADALQPVEGLAAPIIEVERFANYITDPDLLYLADGLQAQLVSDLSHFRTLRVRSVNTSTNGNFSVNDMRPDYFIAGAVNQIQDRIRLTLTMRDASDGSIIWSTIKEQQTAESMLWDRMLTSVRAIVSQLGAPAGVMQAEGMQRLEQRARLAGDEQVSTYECVLRWNAYDTSKSPIQEVKVRKCLTELTDQDTKDASIWAAYALMRFLDWTKQKNLNDKTLLEQAKNAAYKAIRLDPTDAAGHEYLGNIMMAEGADDEALESYRHAISLNPSKPDLRVMLGWVQIKQGNWDSGIAHIEAGIAISPNPPGWFRIPLALNYYRLRDCEQSLNQADLIVLSGDERGIPLALGAAICLGDEREVVRFTYLLRESDISIDDPLSSIKAVIGLPDLMARYENDFQSIQFN